MQAVLQIALLGHFSLTHHDQPIGGLSTMRLQSLLATLVLHPGPQSRQQLAFLFWPDSAEAQARTNLRQLLHSLKQALPDADRFVHADAQSLQWRSEPPVRLDVAEFEAALAQAASAEQRGDAPAERAALEQAVGVYQGDLLPGCYDDWLLPERERLRQAFTAALERLRQVLESQGELRPALATAERLLRHDPLREESYRALMRLHAAVGDRASVVRVFHACQAVLRRELAVEPSPTTRDAYEQALKADLAERPAGPLPPPMHTNLPVPLTSFVGRERELAEAKQLLAQTRLLTLTGPGGTGKTRLALQVAADVRESFAGGAWLVELAPLADPALVAQTIAATLGVREQPGRPLLEALLDYLRAKSLLVILDNCEHLIETCAQLADRLLRAAPGLALLVSSRESLGIAGETVYRVPSLPLPTSDQLDDLQGLAQNDCVHLFVDRALAAYPSFRLTAKNAPAIADICRRLDGIPLAIELAAARMTVLLPEEIAARLGDRFRLLTGGSRAALPRHQTLRALIDWSYDLLPEAERVLLRRLSVFAGGWSFEAAQVVCDDGVDDQMLDVLTHLIDKSLVTVEEEAEERRYRLLETIRQYGRDRLVEAEEASAARDRHLAYYLGLAVEAEARLGGPEIVPALNQLELEHDNIRAALEWALERKPEAVLQMAACLRPFWLIRGYTAEGSQWLRDGLARWQDRSLPGLALRAKALFALGAMRFERGELNTARTCLEECAAVARQAGDAAQLTLGQSLGMLASALIRLGDDVAAEAVLEEGAGLAARVDEPEVKALLLGAQAQREARQGDQAAARAQAQAALAMARRSGNPWRIATAMFGFAILGVWTGDPVEAAAHLEKAEGLFRALGALHLATAMQSERAHFQRRAGHYALAATLYSETIGVYQEQGHRPAVVHELECLAFMAVAQGQTLRAARLLGAAEGLRESLNAPMTALERPEYEEQVAALRAEADGDAWAQAWAEGRALSLDEAVAYAQSSAKSISFA